MRQRLTTRETAVRCRVNTVVWRHPPADVHGTLNARRVHVWRAKLGLEGAGDTTVLSAQERARARRFRFEADRQRFEMGRTMLRCVLGRYLGRPPRSLQLTEGAYGKPVLDDGGATLRFNVSHSRDTILCAVASGSDVGVDVEFVQRDLDWTGIAATWFRPPECQRLSELPSPQAAVAFFDLWVRREAMLKAAGTGLSGSLEADGALVDRWAVWALDTGVDYRAAVAVEPVITDVTCLDWPGNVAPAINRRARGTVRSRRRSLTISSGVADLPSE